MTISLFLKLIAPLVLVLSALTQAGLDYWWKDRRTKTHRRVRAMLIGLLLASGVCSIVVVVMGDQDSKDLKNQLQSIESKLDPFQELAKARFPGLDSGEALKRLSREIKELENQTKVLEQGTAKLQNEALQDRLELEKVKQRQLSRTINSEDSEKIKVLLKASPKGKVIVQSDLADAEAQRLSKQIKFILKESGFEILPVTVQVLALNDRGVFMFIKDKTAVPTHANHIRHAFDSIGVKITGRISPSGMDRFASSDSPNALTSDTVIIWVGQKP